MKLTKTQLREIARIYSGSLLCSVETTSFGDGVSEDNAGIVSEICHEYGRSLLRGRPSVSSSEEIILAIKKKRRTV